MGNALLAGWRLQKEKNPKSAANVVLGFCRAIGSAVITTPQWGEALSNEICDSPHF